MLRRKLHLEVPHLTTFESVKLEAENKSVMMKIRYTGKHEELLQEQDKIGKANLMLGRST